MGYTLPRFLSSLFIIRVTFFILFGFGKGALTEKGQKGTTQGPSYCSYKKELRKIVLVLSGWEISALEFVGFGAMYGC